MNKCQSGPLVECLPKQAGKREHRWCHCLGEEKPVLKQQNVFEHDKGFEEKVSLLRNELMQRIASQDELISILQTQLDDSEIKYNKLFAYYQELKFYTEEMMGQRYRRLP